MASGATLAQDRRAVHITRLANGFATHGPPGRLRLVRARQRESNLHLQQDPQDPGTLREHGAYSLRPRTARGLTKGKPTMKKTLLLLTAIAGVLATPLHAAPITYVATLTGAAEEPSNLSTATGSATIVIDAVAHTLRIATAFSGLLGLSTAAHIHVIGGPGDANLLDTVGPVATVPLLPGFPLGVTSGSYDQTFDTTDAASYRTAFVTDSGGTPLLAEAALFSAIEQGRAYFNVHSTVFPAGEIRGFLALPDRKSVV